MRVRMMIHSSPRRRGLQNNNDLIVSCWADVLIPPRLMVGTGTGRQVIAHSKTYSCSHAHGQVELLMMTSHTPRARRLLGDSTSARDFPAQLIQPVNQQRESSQAGAVR